MMDWMFGDLPMFGFDLILADPPWEFELYSEAGNLKSASFHYDTMPTDEIAAMQVGHLASDNSLLLLYCCGWAIPDALRVMKAWGFKYQSEIAWLKVTKNRKVSMGTGYRVRTQHEPILVGTIGNPEHKPFRSTFEGVARGHSVKPEEFYGIAERAMPRARRLELFARGPRPGWSVWGKEAEKFAHDPGARERRRKNEPRAVSVARAEKDEQADMFGES